MLYFIASFSALTSITLHRNSYHGHDDDDDHEIVVIRKWDFMTWSVLLPQKRNFRFIRKADVALIQSSGQNGIDGPFILTSMMLCKSLSYKFSLQYGLRSTHIK